MTLRPERRTYTPAEAYRAHYRKAAGYRTEAAAVGAAREAEVRNDWPRGACSQYQCPVCVLWHIGRTEAFVKYQQRERRRSEYRADLLLLDVLGERVMAHAKLENTGSAKKRRNHIESFASTLVRVRKRHAREQPPEDGAEVHVLASTRQARQGGPALLQPARNDPGSDGLEGLDHGVVPGGPA